jgi:uncharacterized protein YyaL (SSP411 family)
MADQIRRYPSAFGFALSGLDFYLASPLEVALLASDSKALFGDLWRALFTTYLPNRIIVPSAGDDPRARELVPLLNGRETPKAGATAYVCEHYACQAPTREPAELTRQLSQS